MSCRRSFCFPVCGHLRHSCGAASCVFGMPWQVLQLEARLVSTEHQRSALQTLVGELNGTVHQHAEALAARNDEVTSLRRNLASQAARITALMAAGNVPTHGVIATSAPAGQLSSSHRLLAAARPGIVALSRRYDAALQRAQHQVGSCCACVRPLVLFLSMFCCLVVFCLVWFDFFVCVSLFCTRSWCCVFHKLLQLHVATTALTGHHQHALNLVEVHASALAELEAFDILSSSLLSNLSTALGEPTGVVGHRPLPATNAAPAPRSSLRDASAHPIDALNRSFSSAHSALPHPSVSGPSQFVSPSVSDVSASAMATSAAATLRLANMASADTTGSAEVVAGSVVSLRMRLQQGLREFLTLRANQEQTVRLVTFCICDFVWVWKNGSCYWIFLCRLFFFCGCTLRRCV